MSWWNKKKVKRSGGGTPPVRKEKRRIPLCPRANLSVMNDKGQAKLDAQLDAKFEVTKRKYAAKYGQAALDEELKKYGY